ncbi:MAG: hypothetical protein JWM02_2259 [Frankiales bacterium]|nr:hypothetical protein [Frankiales bacterium]
MSINPIGGNQSYPTQQVQQATGHGHGHNGMRKAGMDAAAQALGMSSDELRTSLQGGKSLSSLAQAKGLSTDALTSAISDALKQANPSLSSDRAAQITQRLIAGPGSGGTGATGQVDRDHDGDSR